MHKDVGEQIQDMPFVIIVCSVFGPKVFFSSPEPRVLETVDEVC